MISLTGNWSLCDFEPSTGLMAGAHNLGFDESSCISCPVPGDVHTSLESIGRIPNPYYDNNAEQVRWVEQKEWWYRTRFTIPPANSDERVELVFDGVDTFATVFLDGEVIGECQNMFTPYRFDITKWAKEGGEHLVAVCFHPITPRLDAIHERRLPEMPGFWGDYYGPRVWARKSSMHFGWDWGPRLVVCGLWKEVRVETHRYARINSLQTSTIKLRPHKAVVDVDVAVERYGFEDSLDVKVRICDGSKAWEQTAVINGDKVSINFIIPDPKPWWTHDLGEQTLYKLEAILLKDGQEIDLRKEQFGIRTIHLDQSPGREEGTKNFTFVLNGVHIFAKGADWIPCDHRTGAVSFEHTKAVTQLAKEANMNMLRVWGGGIYDDNLCKACDELGILIWQDFMFACSAIPDHDEDFVAEVKREAEVAIEMLGNHPCMALWCGNNENQWLDELINWQGWPDRRCPGSMIYDEVLPSVLRRMRPHDTYWPGSPYGGSDHNDEREGDRHNWQPWGGMMQMRRFGENAAIAVTPETVSFRNYAKDTGRFISEYGIHGSPMIESLVKNIPPDERFYDSPAFINRIKDPNLERKERMMLAHTGLPSDLEQYVLFSSLIQAEGLRFAIEHYRRRMFECSGSLFWQLNDSWPGISWSVLDYYLRPKASYYYIRRAYDPVLFSLRWKDGAIEVWGVNDTLRSIRGRARMQLMEFDGKIRWHQEWEYALQPNSSSLLLTIYDIPLVDPERSVFRVHSLDGQFRDNVLLVNEFKDLKLPPTEISIETVLVSDNAYMVTLRSPVYTHFVHFGGVADLKAEDNYFSLFPNEPRAALVILPLGVEVGQLVVRSLNG